MDVNRIVITSSLAGTMPPGVSLPGFLQVSEVVALNESGVDQARAGLATATGTSFPGSNPNNAIDGIAPAAFADIYHSATSSGSESLVIDFITPFKLTALSIFGRLASDAIEARDVYDVEIFNSQDVGIFSAFNQSAVNNDNVAIVRLPGAAVIPVPAALPLFASALGVLGGLGWRRKRALA
ncbi:MAG: hypothetical protein AAF862_12150 [Pseudomonadota bacterium]